MNDCRNKLIKEVINQVRGQELKILDEFSKAFLASEMLTGKDLVGIINEFELTIKTDYSGSSITTKYSYRRITDNS